jgi:hypothetical protein
MTQHTKETMTPAQLLLRVVGVAFASVVLFALLAVLGQGGTAEAADHPAGLGDVLGPGATGNGLAPIVAPVADVVAPIVQPLPPVVAPAVVTHAPVLQTLAPVVTPLTDLVAPIADTVVPVVAPVTDTVAPIAETVVPVVDAVVPGVDPVGVIVTPVVDPAGPGVAPVDDPVGPVVAPVVDPVVPVVAPVTDGIQPDVDTVVPSATVGPDSEATTSAESTAAPDPAAEPNLAIDGEAVTPGVDAGAIETSAAAVADGESAASRSLTSNAVAPADPSDVGRVTAVVGHSTVSSNGRTTSGPGPRSGSPGSFPGGSNVPGVLPSIVTGLLSGGTSSSPTPGGAPTAMLAVLTATAAAMFMLSRRVTTDVSWRSALVLSSVERPG